MSMVMQTGKCANQIDVGVQYILITHLFHRGYSRTIIGDYMSQLVHDLDEFMGITWTTGLKESDDQEYWIFSVRFNSGD